MEFLAQSKGARQILKTGLVAIKKRRVSRTRAGQPTIGFRVVQKRQRAYNKGMRKGGMPNTLLTSQTSSVPAAVQTSTVKRGADLVATIHRCEYSKPVLSTANAGPEGVPLNAMNTDIFKSLPNVASQYQYFKFRNVKVTYTHSIDTANPGSIAWGVAASSEAAASVTSYDQIQGLNSACTTNIYSDKSFVIGPKDWNQQFGNQGCSIKPWEATDDSNPLYVPGYLVSGQSGVTAALGTQLGTVTLEYSIYLFKEKVDQDPQGPPPTMIHATFAGAADWWTPVVNQYNKQTWLHKSITLQRISSSQLRIHSSDTRTYAIHLNVFSATGTKPVVTAAGVNAIVRLNASQVATLTGCTYTYVVQYLAPGGYVELASDGTQGNGVSLNIHAVKSYPGVFAAHGAALL